jgi:hypothetical protein
VLRSPPNGEPGPSTPAPGTGAGTAGTPGAANSPPVAHSVLQSPPINGDGRSANLALLSLLLCLLGFLVVGYVLYEFKFHAVTDSLHGLPTRVIFVVGILLVTAPFLVTIFRRVPVLFLVPPLFLLFFIYPIFTPYGIPYNRDSIFLYQLAHVLLSTGAWTPGVGVTLQAVPYSYYPGAAIFSAEAASLTSTTLFSSFPWTTELFRFLVVPPVIYALTRRLFGPRAAPLAALLYAVVPSIEMNVPTQQDFAVVFFLLALTCLAFLALKVPASDSPFLSLSVVMATSVVIISHYTSTYLMLAILAAVAFLPRILWRHDPYPAARSIPVFAWALALAILWAVLVALPAVTLQWTVLTSNLVAVLHPTVPTSAITSIPGASFPDYELAWVGLPILAMGVIALLTLLEAKRRDDRSLVTILLITALLLGIVSIPFISTGFNFLALRELEFTGVILAPVSAWWITTRLAADRRRPVLAPDVPPQATRLSRRATAPLHRPRTGAAGHPGFALFLVAIFVTGGALVPLSIRDQFAPSSEYQLDSPMFINHDAYAAAEWAEAHMARDHGVWGDYLAYTVFGGFADLKIQWDAYLIFNGTGFSQQAVYQLNVGDYIVTDRYLTTFYTNPMFFGPTNDQPSAPLSTAELAKFQNTAYFSVIFENPVFTIYVVTAIPPAS